MDLTCYLHPSWAPRLRPAASKRDWMDATPERFAYRCLPLAIANAHGWEIGSPCGFRARWNGGKGAEAVQIECDAGASLANRPVSLFGAGTITFHVEGLFRTTPGWNLWVGGPPNAAKHGLAPLAGVIETDWSPYTFTMNWRFTKPGEWVRFEEDEAFCFLFPVERGVLDGVEPVLRSLSDAPDLDCVARRLPGACPPYQAQGSCRQVAEDLLSRGRAGRGAGSGRPPVEAACSALRVARRTGTLPGPQRKTGRNAGTRDGTGDGGEGDAAPARRPGSRSRGHGVHPKHHRLWRTAPSNGVAGASRTTFGRDTTNSRAATLAGR